MCREQVEHARRGSESGRVRVRGRTAGGRRDRRMQSMREERVLSRRGPGDRVPSEYSVGSRLNARGRVPVRGRLLRKRRGAMRAVRGEQVLHRGNECGGGVHAEFGCGGGLRERRGVHVQRGLPLHGGDVHSVPSQRVVRKQ